MKRYYTQEENNMIIAAKREEFDILAERLGRSRKNIRNQQHKLLNIEPGVYHAGRPEKYNKTNAKPISKIIPPFARPDWFNEDIESISKSK